jgi:hypothetical protein
MFVFLMALGSDYNILVMSRIREEAHHLPLRDAVARAIGKTGSTVTTAGVILGGSFAVLAISVGGTAGAAQIQQIGYGIAAGVLMDTFFVRSLLVPSSWCCWVAGTGGRRGSASTLPAGKPSITFEWYRSFLQLLIDNHAQTWFGWIIAIGETAVGVGILVGALVGIAAFFGATMNMSYMLAGSASTNPILFALTVGLMLGWRVAGYYGVDRFLLPMLGVPWNRKPPAIAQAPAIALPPQSAVPGS